MTVQLELKPETERTLRAAAEARHIPVEDYLVSLVESALHPSGNALIEQRRDVAAFSARLRKLSEIAGPVPRHDGETWSREVLYADHD